jgi:membrane protein implicated in regulation of membrane protease activity
LVAPAAASNELVKSVRGVIFLVFLIALVSEIVGLITSFIVYVSPSAIAGILAALSYVLALQIRRMRDRVHIELEDTSSKQADMVETFNQSISMENQEDYQHEH